MIRSESLERVMRRARRLTILAVAALAVSGCSNILPSAPPPQLPVVAVPVVPAYALGEPIGGRAARVKKARAAGLRPVTAGEVIDYVSREEAELRRQTAGTGVDVIRSGNMLLVRLPALGTFEVGKSEISPQARSTITEIALTLKSFNRTLVDVLGHTDATGSLASNKTLSERRAQAIARHLTARGVAPARVATRGYAAAYPLGDNATEEGRALNRRVEIKIVPIAG
jgi:outer membrane protein OmpA-like peptidoglycan-associated protein